MLADAYTQVANLITARNRLTSPLTTEKVTRNWARYQVAYDDHGTVVATARLRRRAWYDTEICHLSVLDTHEGHGLGGKMLDGAIAQAQQGGARVVTATIALDNARSIHMFRGRGFRVVTEFTNRASERRIGVFHKVL
jgi:L-amino acid N-acyltransferase YncA